MRHTRPQDAAAQAVGQHTRLVRAAAVDQFLQARQFVVEDFAGRPVEARGAAAAGAGTAAPLFVDRLQAGFQQYQATNGSVNTAATSQSDAGIEGGFPIAKNHLFFFGAIDPSELGERIRIMLDSTKLLYDPATMRNYTMSEYILKSLP